MQSIQKRAFIHALAVVIYVTGVAWFMNHAEQLFGSAKPQPEWVGAVVFLLVFVLSAGITGSLVFGRPLMMYLDGQKKQAVMLAIKTLLWLAVFVVAGVLILILV